tara:strand:- start:2099 stop:2347 length:249 start_codon:yes stop_codon:yes gene_type:complete
MIKKIMESLNLKTRITNLVQFFLAFDGVLHILEIGSAYYEKAWATLILTTFHAMIFFIAIYLIGHEFHHPKKNDNKEIERGD